MKALICNEPNNLEIIDLEKPTPLKNEVLIRVKRVGICGTDYNAVLGTQPFINYPLVLGHEVSGEVVAWGEEVKDLKEKDMVTLLPYVNCGSCHACDMGLYNCCENIQVLGVHADGGLSEYFKVDRKFLVVENALDFNQLAIVEPLAIAAHGINRSAVKKQDHVLIMGAGPIGLAVLGQISGKCKSVTVVDVSEERLEACKAFFEGVLLCNPQKVDVVDFVKNNTQGAMIDCVFDATGNLAALESGFHYLAHGSRYVLIGLQKQAISFSHPEFHKREGTLMSSRNATKSEFKDVIAFLLANPDFSKNYISNVIDMQAGEQCFERSNRVIKNIIKISE